MTCHPIIAHAIRRHAADPRTIMELTAKTGCTFALHVRAGMHDAPEVTTKPGFTTVRWNGQRDVHFYEKVEGRRVSRRVTVRDMVPETVLAAIVGRPLRDLVGLPDDPGMVVVDAVHTPTGFDLILGPWTDATIIPEAA